MSSAKKLRNTAWGTRASMAGGNRDTSVMATGRGEAQPKLRDFLVYFLRLGAVGAIGDVPGMGARRNAGSDADGRSVRFAVAIDGDGAGSAVRTFWAAAVDTGSVLRSGCGSDCDYCAECVQTDSQHAEK